MTAKRTWNFVRVDGGDKVALPFQPLLSMNDLVGLAEALVSGAGIGDLPPLARSSGQVDPRRPGSSR